MNKDFEYPAEMVVGQFTYRLRKYTPKRKGQPAGHGWVRREPRAEVGYEAHLLLDEIAWLRRKEAQ